MRAFLVLACIAAVSRADDPVQAAAAMIERYGKTGDGAFLVKRETRSSPASKRRPRGA